METKNSSGLGAPRTPPGNELSSSMRSRSGGLGESNDSNLLNDSIRSNTRSNTRVSGGGNAPPGNELSSSMRSNRSLTGAAVPAPQLDKGLNSSWRSGKSASGGGAGAPGGDSDDLMKSSMRSGAGGGVPTPPASGRATPKEAATPPASRPTTPAPLYGAYTSANASRAPSASGTRPPSASGSRPVTPPLIPSASTPSAPPRNGGTLIDTGMAPGTPDRGGKGALVGAAQARMQGYGKAAVEEAPMAPIVHADADTMQHELGFRDEKTGTEVPSPLQLFLQYDQDGCGGIKMWEFKQLLIDLDGLEGVDKKIIDKFVAEEFAKADQSNAGVLGIDEFYVYYYSTLCFKFPILRTGVNPGADLFNIFVKFASAGDNGRNEEMGCHQFSNCIRACKLIDGKRVTKAGVDIMYWRARAADETLEDYTKKPGVYCTAKMYYPQFLFALQHLAHKRRSGFQEVVAQILSNCSATPEATLSDFVLMTNTGGPDEEECHLLRPRGLPPAPRILNSNVDRIRAEATRMKEYMKGRKATRAAGNTGDGAESEHAEKTLMTTMERKNWGFGETTVGELRLKGQEALNCPRTMHKVRLMDPDALMLCLKRAFEAYNKANGGLNKSSMDKVKWMRCLRDAQLIGAVQACSGGVSQKTAEGIFASMLSTGKRHINYIEFIEALRHVSNALRQSINEVMQQLVAFGGPQYGL